MAMGLLRSGVNLLLHASPTLHRCATPLCSTSNRIQTFNEWLALDDARITPVQLDGWGTCLAANEPLDADQPLLRVPKQLHISRTSAAASPLALALPAIEEAVDGDESAVVALHLLFEASLGDESAWAPYIAVLPEAGALDVPILWQPDELRSHFAGSHMTGMIDSIRAQIAQGWANLASNVFPQIPELVPPGSFEVEGPGAFSLERYFYAHALVLSRGLPFGDELSLIPLLDFANHEAGSPNACSIMVSAGGQWADAISPEQLTGADTRAAAVLSAGRAHKAGEQVFIDYGEASWRSSWEMLYNYGFVPGSSLRDWLSTGGRPLFFDGIARDDPLREQKVALLVALGADESSADGVWVDVQPRAAECTSMAPLLRLAHLSSATQPEIAERLASWGADPRELWQQLQKPVGTGVERAVAEQVLAVCRGALEDLPAAEELAQRAAGSPQEATARTSRSQLAGRVLSGERNALEVCTAVWQEVLVQ